MYPSKVDDYYQILETPRTTLKVIEGRSKKEKE
jgi:hypothetical protein